MEVQSVTVRARDESIRLADIPSMSAEQYDAQPYHKPLTTWMNERTSPRE